MQMTNIEAGERPTVRPGTFRGNCGVDGTQAAERERGASSLDTAKQEEVW